MFQRGPHKFLHGTYPRVTDAFTKRLLHIVLIVIRKHRGEKYAQLLLRSVDKLDIALHPSFITFLLLLSNIHRDIGVPGSIRIQNQNSLGCDTNSNTAPYYTTFEIPDCLCSDWHNFALSGNRCNRLVTSAQPINPPYIDKSEPSDFSLNDRNLFTNLLYFSHRFSLASHFFGAFSHIGPEARRMLAIQGSAPLQLPPLSTDSHKTSALNFGLSQTPTYEEKDEGYSDTSDYLKRPTCLNDVEALQWLRNLIAGATEGISDFLLSEICPLLVDSQPNLHCSSKPSVAMPSMGRGRGRYYWSNRGSCIPSKELPFLTESGPWGSLALFTAFSQRFSSLTSLPHEDVKQSGLFIATPSALLNDLEFVEARLSFFQDLLLLRMGTQSSRFKWELPPNKEEQNCNEPLVGQFHYCLSSFDAVILGISESVLTNLIQTHLMCGTYYRRLCWFMF
ncbi:unnamed protein product [Dicrocoelium dendriticum]|nr:unnamed protein product [Dicrocoelium dendriticum]